LVRSCGRSSFSNDREGYLSIGGEEGGIFFLREDKKRRKDKEQGRKGAVLHGSVLPLRGHILPHAKGYEGRALFLAQGGRAWLLDMENPEEIGEKCCVSWEKRKGLVRGGKKKNQGEQGFLGREKGKRRKKVKGVESSIRGGRKRGILEKWGGETVRGKGARNRRKIVRGGEETTGGRGNRNYPGGTRARLGGAGALPPDRKKRGPGGGNISHHEIRDLLYKRKWNHGKGSSGKRGPSI